MDDIFDLSDFLSGNMSDPNSGNLAAMQNDAWFGGNVAAQPMVSPYPAGIDPATAAYSNMLGANQPSSPSQTDFSLMGGGSPAAAKPLTQAQPMQVGSGGDQPINYPGQPQSASSIGQAARPC